MRTNDCMYRAVRLRIRVLHLFARDSTLQFCEVVNMFSNRSYLLRFLLGAGLLIAALLTPALSPAQNELPGDEDLARQQAIMERYFTVLEKNPRKSTALDKLYGFHVENGSLEKLV